MQLPKKNLTSSKSIDSEPHWGVTWIVRIVFVVFGILPILVLPTVCVALLYEEYQYDSENSGLNMVILVLVTSVFAFLFYLGIRFLKKSIPKTVVHIHINEKGVYYTHKDGSISSILYSDLKYSNVWGEADIFIKTEGFGKYQKTEMKVFIADEQGVIKPMTMAFSIDIVYAYYPKNHETMRAFWLKNVVIQRPDLCISHKVFSDYYIDKKDFTIKKEERNRDVLIGIIGGLLLGLLAFYLAFTY